MKSTNQSTIKYENLDKDFLLKFNNSTIKIIKNKVKFFLHINLKFNNEKLVVFSNGAIDRNRARPPVFMRKTWQKDIEASCIFIDDPTIHYTNLTIGWGIGHEKHYYLESISSIIKKISLLLRYDSKNIVYYGSSAGGTMSIMLATLHNDTRAIANNPQAFTDKYFDGKVLEKIIKSLYFTQDKNTVLKREPNRFSIVECFKHHNYTPEVLYVFNRESYTDYDKQFVPFINQMKEENISLEPITFLMYHDKVSQHSPISKSKTIKIINDYII